MKTITANRRGRIYNFLVDDQDYDYLNQFKWFACLTRNAARRPYAKRYSQKNNLKLEITMHREIAIIAFGELSSKDYVDHIDRDTLNNQRKNLRTCTPTENCFNRSKWTIRTSSKFKGVCKRHGAIEKTWRARISKNGFRHNLGDFRTEKEAALAYDEKAIELFGEFAVLNIV